MFCRPKYLLCFLCMPLAFEVFGQTGYSEVVAQGLRFQIQADSLQRLVEAQTVELSTVSESGRVGIMIAIYNNDTRAVALQQLANERFEQAGAYEQTSARPAIVNARAAEHNAISEMTQTDTEIVIIKESKFAILFKSPYSAANPIPVDEPLPDGVAYKIQLGAFSRTLSANTFKGLTPISGEKLENGVTKYYVGLFWRYSDADDALRKVREYGFKDAFIAAFFNNKSISPERARQLETLTN